MTTLGSAAADMLLVARTYAFCGGEKRILIAISSFGMVALVLRPGHFLVAQRSHIILGHNGSHANSYNYCRESIRKSSVRRMGRTTKHHLRFAHNLSACVDVPDTLQTLQILPNGEWSVGYYYISGWCILHVVHYSVFDDELGRHACASFIICSRFLWARPTDSHAQCSHLTHPIQSTSSERIEGCRWKPAGCPKDGLCSTDPNSILCGSFRTVG